MKLHSTRRTAFGAVAAVGLAALAAGVSVTPAFAAASAGTLSVTSGPSAGGNSLTLTIPSTATSKFASGFNVGFYAKASATTTCAANYVAPGSNLGTTAPKLMSSTKIAFTVPTGVVVASGSSSTAWLLCVYPGTSTTTSALTANATYTVAVKPTIAAMNASPAGIVPAAAPALGGTQVTVNGTNFITGLTAKIGTVPLTGISIASNGNSFTATVPAQAAATNLPLSVTTTGGTAVRTNAFSYTNGIIVAPTTAPTNTAATDLDIMGVGFSALNFTTTTGLTTTVDDTNAHVYLVDGVYDPTDDTNGAKTVGETGECVNVMVISDTELICTLNTADAFNQSGDPSIADGVYTVAVVNDGQVDVQADPDGAGALTDGANYDSTDPFTPSILSSGSTFTVAPY